jgi:hypothetical protein
MTHTGWLRWAVIYRFCLNSSLRDPCGDNMSPNPSATIAVNLWRVP